MSCSAQVFEAKPGFSKNSTVKDEYSEYEEYKKNI